MTHNILSNCISSLLFSLFSYSYLLLLLLFIFKNKYCAHLYFSRPNSVTFSVPFKDVHTRVQPQKGDVVSFSYRFLSQSGLPVNPVITRVRDDVKWIHVIQNYLDNVPHLGNLNGNFLLLYLFFILPFFNSSSP